MINYKIINEIVSVDDYMKLRKLTLGEKERKWAEKVANSWYGVYVVYENETIGTGRIIGDGGLTFQITDIMVHPNYQGKGIGKSIMDSLMDYYTKNAPKDAYLSLMADGNAKFLYKKYGFSEMENTIGMKYMPNN